MSSPPTPTPQPANTPPSIPPPGPPVHHTSSDEKLLLSNLTVDPDAKPPNSYLQLQPHPHPQSRTQILLTILFALQIALLCAAETIVSLGITPSRPGMWSHGRSWKVGSEVMFQCEWVGCEPVVQSELIGRERVMFWVWTAFTMLSVFSGALSGALIWIFSVLEKEEEREASRLKMWVVGSHVAVGMVWVHACVAWSVVGERLVGDVTDGGWVIGCVIMGVAGGLLFTFFVTTVWGIAELAMMRRGGGTREDQDEDMEGREYQITL